MSSRSDYESRGRKSQLRASYVWRDEVMADVVATEPRDITVGTRPGATFTTPELGLPPSFAIIRPGSRGYLLTLGAGMTGRLKLGGEELAVADFVARGHGERAEGVEAPSAPPRSARATGASSTSTAAASTTSSSSSCRRIR